MEDTPPVILVIPAHNEGDSIEETLDSVLMQTRLPDRFIVMADNCTDNTIDVVRAHDPRWEVWESVDNQDKKAGALNQAWRELSQQYGDDAYLLMMDADTALEEVFIENALFAAQTRPNVGGICATFFGKPGGGFLGFMQRLEYARFARSLNRKRGNTFVLSGTATLFPFPVLRLVSQDRGYLYDRTALIEDYELSLALRMRGLRIYAPKNVRVLTDVMETVPKLWNQRIRWQRGTLHELKRYGWNRVTLPDIARQFLLAISTFARIVFLTLIFALLLTQGHVDINWAWVAVSAVIALERAVTIRHLGPRYIAIALVLVFEEMYGIFRETFFLRSAWLAFFGNPEWEWHKT